VSHEFAREKLREAANTIRDDEQPIGLRLRSAYVHALANVQAERVEDEGIRHGLDLIEDKLTASPLFNDYEGTAQAALVGHAGADTAAPA
jgi:hypothetical protein